MTPAKTVETWTFIGTCPIPGLELIGDGRFRAAGRVFRVGTPLAPLVVGTVRLENPSGGTRIRVLAPLGETALLYRRGGWYRLAHPDGEDPLAPGATVVLSLDDDPPGPEWGTGLPVAEEVDERPARPAKPPTPPPLPPQRAGWLPRRIRVTAAVLVVSAAATAAGSAVAQHATYDPDAGSAAYTVVTNGLYNRHAAELALWAVGLVVFGLMVERNAGSVRTGLVVLAGSAGGVAGWWLFNTPDGLAVANREAARVFWWLLEHRGPSEALAFAESWDELLPHLRWEASVAGAAGVCGALIGYAAVRRRLDTADPAVRPVKFGLAAVYVAVLAAVAWPAVAPTPFPYAVLVGGFLAGAALVVPEKAFNYLREAAADHLREKARA